MESILKTQNLCKRYREKYACNNVTMTVNRGDIYGFVGLNGAGKTTLLRVITGLAKKTSGEFSLFGTSDNNKIHIERNRVSSLVETPALYMNMNGEDNLKVHTAILGSNENIPALLQFVGLNPKNKCQARDFSLGMKQRLAIAMALCGNPEFLILDEPVNGLDPEGIIDIRNLLIRLNKERGVTILISSHLLSELSRLATCYGFIHNGNIIKEITASDVDDECGKNTILTVSNVANAIASLPNAIMIDQNKISIKGEANVSEIVQLLSSAGVIVSNLSVESKDLENYFMGLIGGEQR